MTNMPIHAVNLNFHAVEMCSTFPTLISSLDLALEYTVHIRETTPKSYFLVWKLIPVIIPHGDFNV